MATAFDIPPQNRGTVSIGGTLYHFQRSTKTGQLMLVYGKDTRDWFAIDRGALDYTAIARQEHDEPGFVRHDGPKIQAACALCNGTALDGANPTKDPDAALRSLAAQGNPQAQAALRARGLDQANTNTANSTVVEGLEETLLDAPARAADADLQRRIDQAVTEATAAREEADRLRAQLDHAEEARLAPVEDPGPGPLSDLERGDRPVDNLTLLAGPHDPARSADPDDPRSPGDVTAAENKAAWAAADPENPNMPPDAGTDPWTGETVNIMWKVPGASPEKPYGAKANGEPRKPVGRKAPASAS